MKLGIAAVVIAVAGIGMLEFVSSGHKSGVVWAEVLEKTEQTSAVAFDMTIEVNEPAGKLVRPLKAYMAGEYGTRLDSFVDGKLTEIFYRLPRKNVNYRILVDRKQYWRRDVSYDQAALERDPDDPRTMLKRLLSGDDYTKLGRTTIDGVVVEGVEGRQLESGGETVGRIWVDVETNLPVRIEMTGMEGHQMMKLVMENFEWNAQLDESFFEPNIPADYTPVEDRPKKQARQEQSSDQPATPQALTEQEKAALPDNAKYEQMTPKEVAAAFFAACAKQDWDELLKYMGRTAVSQRLKDYLGGLEVVQLGEPFQAGQYPGWFVPYQIKLKAGYIKQHNLAIRNDNPAHRCQLDGGI